MSNKRSYWFVYPFFYNILSALLSLLSKTTNPGIKANRSEALCKLIAYVIANDILSEEEKEDLFAEIIKCLERLSSKHEPIDKDKIKKVAEKIENTEIKN